MISGRYVKAPIRTKFGSAIARNTSASRRARREPRRRRGTETAADKRTSLGDRPAGRIRALWHVRLREPAGRGRGRLVGDADIHASQHPPYVRVDDRVALSERET